MKYLYSFIIFLFISFFPLNVFADSAGPEHVIDSDHGRLSANTISRRPAVAQNSSRPNNNDERRDDNKHSLPPKLPVNNYHHPNMPPARVYHNSYRSHQYYNKPPRPRATHVVTYSRPSTTIAINETSSINTCTLCNDVNFGFGLRGVVAINSKYNNIEKNIYGGIGYYIKYRPIRYFSIEFINDYLFGNLTYDDNEWNQEFVKVPFSLGARFHFFDYGYFDLYAAIAATASVWSYKEGYDYWMDKNIYMRDVGMQFGGQFGLGISLTSSIFEFGLDARYTLENIPDFIPYYNERSDNEQVVHGLLLSFNVGFNI